MEPRPAHNGGSVSANAGAELAALISARGTSVWTRRSIMFREPVASGVWQTRKSGPNGDGSTAVALAPARVTMLPASSVASAAPPSAAAPAENISLCDRVTVAMENSEETDLPNLDFTGRTEPGSNGSPGTPVLMLSLSFRKTRLKRQRKREPHWNCWAR